MRDPYKFTANLKQHLCSPSLRSMKQTKIKHSTHLIRTDPMKCTCNSVIIINAMDTKQKLTLNVCKPPTDTTLSPSFTAQPTLVFHGLLPMLRYERSGRLSCFNCIKCYKNSIKDFFMLKKTSNKMFLKYFGKTSNESHQIFTFQRWQYSTDQRPELKRRGHNLWRGRRRAAPNA